MAQFKLKLYGFSNVGGDDDYSIEEGTIYPDDVVIELDYQPSDEEISNWGLMYGHFLSENYGVFTDFHYIGKSWIKDYVRYTWESSFINDDEKNWLEFMKDNYDEYVGDMKKLETFIETI
jgi:hypothetical protein